ncbi:MAG: hypothetical protein AB7O49_16610 [Sphingomonadales bacterium]
MGLSYENLDASTRRFMVEEIEMDAASGALYLSSYLNDHGCEAWPRMLRDAAASGTDDTLAEALRRDGCLRSRVERRTSRSRASTAAVPYTAHETIAEGEFNRYYVRGLCRRAIAEGVATLEVYRAKPVARPRPESQRRVGTLVDPAAILADLRATNGVEPALGVPAGPNSGLSLRLPPEAGSPAPVDAAPRPPASRFSFPWRFRS